MSPKVAVKQPIFEFHQGVEAVGFQKKAEGSVSAKRSACAVFRN
jgi:hypothetical protein